MAILPHTLQLPGGGSVTIYSESGTVGGQPFSNINYFLRNALDPDTLDGVVNAQTTVSAHTREQYPGDPSASNVSASTREFLKDPTRKSGNALPGKKFMLVAKGENGETLEKRSFTYKGRWLDLHSFLASEAKYDLFAYNASGARSTIAKTLAP
jgi:hypothetical protein